MNRFLTLGFGAIGYVLFVAAFLYAIGFVGGFAVPRTVDAGVPAPLGEAVAINLVLLGLFGAQHSVMARPGFKRWWTRYVPPTLERSIYVLAASLLLFLLYWQWRAMPTVLWQVTAPAGRLAVQILFWLGWITVLTTTFMVSHSDLTGLRQVYLSWRGRAYTEIGFRVRGLYRLVRHPMMLGFIIAFWATPTMTAGHLLFAMVTTGYILVALRLEERDLLAALGARYHDYRRRVPMLVPRPHRRREARHREATPASIRRRPV